MARTKQTARRTAPPKPAVTRGSGDDLEEDEDTQDQQYGDEEEDIIQSLGIRKTGTIGLPLNERDAWEIWESAFQAGRYGAGEDNGGGMNICELDFESVTFDNPEWKDLLTGVVKAVCEGLGVDFMKSKPRCDFEKLILLTAGSHSIPHVDDEVTAGTFATVLIVLPSTFEGGETHLSHTGLSTIYDSSTTSAYKTTVMAWYTGVTHEIKPVTSGYQLAMVYKLVHTTNAPRPVLKTNQKATQRLRDILHDWQNTSSNKPEKILMLLDHKYEHEDLRASELQGTDVVKVGILSTLTREPALSKFQLGLATVVFWLNGSGSDPHIARRRNPNWTSDEEGDWYMEHGLQGGGTNLKFNDVEETEIEVKAFVDLEGRKIKGKTLQWDADKEVVPVPHMLVRELERFKFEKQDVDEFLGDGFWSLTRYRRTVLVIRPVHGSSKPNSSRPAANPAAVAGPSRVRPLESPVSPPRAKRTKLTARKSGQPIAKPQPPEINSSDEEKSVAPPPVKRTKQTARKTGKPVIRPQPPKIGSSSEARTRGDSVAPPPAKRTKLTARKTGTVVKPAPEVIDLT
ncbi:hypothetical protein EIP91_002852 [Steccherinum ochraceum]|uniref:Prolyl 4-hydroxylase alpha subunit Fe(2+) 2OG dioxygenase domain-containing protein n=1 Tax=Steccherinum ochraceum TaxID=92696 RepID=A0A4R0RBB2_9APHY|nr:hypothetical protein EIP91_002852 [Steccherinum ochraceum]